MTPARRAKLECAIGLIEQTEAHLRPSASAAARNAMIGMGATFKRADPFVLRLAGITATCAWADGHPLIRIWLQKAKAELAKQEPA